MRRCFRQLNPAKIVPAFFVLPQGDRYEPRKIIAQEVKERAESQAAAKIQLVQTKYIEKFNRIRESQRKKEVAIRQKIEQQHAKNVHRKVRQIEGYSKQKESEQIYFESLRSQIDQKSTQKSSFSPNRLDPYWKEQRELNKETQRENAKRIKIIEEHRRKRVWDTHSTLEEKLVQNADSLQAQQTLARTISIQDRERREKTFDFLQKMADVTFVKSGADKERLEGLIRGLDQKFGLGLKLPNKSSVSPK